MIPRVPVVSSSASNSRYTFALTISRILLENDDRFLLPLYPFDRRLARGAEENAFVPPLLEITLWPIRQPIWKCHPEETIHQATAKELNDRAEIDRDPR